MVPFMAVRRVDWRQRGRHKKRVGRSDSGRDCSKRTGLPDVVDARRGVQGKGKFLHFLSPTGGVVGCFSLPFPLARKWLLYQAALFFGVSRRVLETGLGVRASVPPLSRATSGRERNAKRPPGEGRPAPLSRPGLCIFSFPEKEKPLPCGWGCCWRLQGCPAWDGGQSLLPGRRAMGVFCPALSNSERGLGVAPERGVTYLLAPEVPQRFVLISMRLLLGAN